MNDPTHSSHVPDQVSCLKPVGAEHSPCGHAAVGLPCRPFSEVAPSLSLLLLAAVFYYVDEKSARFMLL